MDLLQRESEYRKNVIFEKICLLIYENAGLVYPGATVRKTPTSKHEEKQ